VVAAAGNVEHERFVDRVAAEFERRAAGAPGRARAGGQPGAGAAIAPAGPSAVAGVVPTAAAVCRSCVDRGSAQTHVVWGCPTFGQRDPRRFALALLSSAFGGGMSSRLFQRVREELGLAYAVYSFQSFYESAGVSGVYVGTRPEWADRAESVIEAELARVAAEGLTPDELADAQGQVKGQIVLSLESSGARLHRLAGTELYGEPFRTAEEVIALIDAVTLDETAVLSAEYFSPGRQTVLRLGPAH
jgi:predicted Zn-dependent peptidase